VWAKTVDPPIQVESATWSAAGTLDWWVKEHRRALSGTGVYEVQMKSSDGSGLLIFVL
jgi:hypothetical protein